jgi:hypothetical protein
VQPIVSDLQDLRDVEPAIRAAAALSPQAVVVFININPDLTQLDANFLNVQRLRATDGRGTNGPATEKHG